MLFQKPSLCGPYAIVNVCLALGHDHTGQISEIASYAGTTRALGTNEHGMILALQRLNYVATQLAAPSSDNLWVYVTTAIAHGDGIILCTDGEDHWVAAIGMCGGPEGRVVVFDSDNSAKNLAASGVQIYDEDQFHERLGGSAYAIRVSDEPSESDSLGHDIETNDKEGLAPGSSADVMSSIQELILTGGKPEFKPSASPSGSVIDNLFDSSTSQSDVKPTSMPSHIADLIFGDGAARGR